MCRDFDTTVSEQPRIHRLQTAVSLCPAEIGSGRQISRVLQRHKKKTLLTIRTNILIF